MHLSPSEPVAQLPEAATFGQALVLTRNFVRRLNASADPRAQALGRVWLLALGATVKVLEQPEDLRARQTALRLWQAGVPLAMNLGRGERELPPVAELLARLAGGKTETRHE